MAKFVLCCGSGIVTSTHIRKKIEEELDKRGYKGKYSITQCRASEAATMSDGHDAVISTTVLKTKCACPIIVATGLLMNRGTKEIYDQIESYLLAEKQ